MVFKVAFYQIGAFHSRTADDWEKIDSSPHLSPQFYFDDSPTSSFGTSSTLPFGIEYNKFLSQYYKKWRLLVFKILTKIHTLYINIFSRLLYKQWDLEFSHLSKKSIKRGHCSVCGLCTGMLFLFVNIKSDIVKLID